MSDNLVGEELEDVQEETLPRADCSPFATDRGGNRQRKTYPACVPRSGHQRTELVSLAQGVWRPETGAARRLKELEKENSRVAATGDGAFAGEAGPEDVASGNV